MASRVVFVVVVQAPGLMRDLDAGLKGHRASGSKEPDGAIAKPIAPQGSMADYASAFALRATADMSLIRPALARENVMKVLMPLVAT
jgi:hypothetical protein